MGSSDYYSNYTNTSTDNINYYLERVPCEPDSSTLGSACDFVKYGGDEYHLGSLAFGSFIIAVVQMIRIILEYIEYKLKDSENRVAKFIIKVVVLDKVTDFLLFLSKVLVTGIVFTMAFIWFKGNITYFDSYVTRPELNYYLTPVIILTLSCYLMACVFFGVYSMAVDTLFLCFLEDLERNDGSVAKPYFMSKGLMKVLGKKNEKLKEPKNKESDQAKKAPKTAKVAPEDKTEKRPLPEPNKKGGAKGKWAG
ncbi:choline transporter-like protein 2 [Elysia marginata]|uniref:Choline transporter-like protein n=1 Tax=Elysia marginata TaxID=1093978 RepID=A0AAV4FBZ0_9GAST|nr:choline transporter-like protein 2 [Elysia marginata]